MNLLLMKFILILSIILISFEIYAPYHGIRVGMKPKSFLKDIIYIVDNLLDNL